MSSVFLTGFPGFLGSALLERLLDRYPETVTFNCLVQSKFRKQADARLQQIEAGGTHRRGRIILFEGDITDERLGLGERYAVLQEDTIEIFHLAAVYALGIARDIAMKVNVDGTKHMLDFAKGCPNLNRFQYVSTCYVSGRYDGDFAEDDLAVGQHFNNFYEETKYLAEVEVQTAMRGGLPTTIYRPGIVVGDSRTGETQKYDGPYYVLQLVARQPFVAVMPMLGDATRYEINLVPRDFVVNAIDYLSGIERSKNVVYQIANPQAPTIAQVQRLIRGQFTKPILHVPLPKGLTKTVLKRVPPARWLAQVEPESLEYFTHPTRYRCDNMLRDLTGSGIECPPLDSYFHTLYNFWESNRQFSSKAMV